MKTLRQFCSVWILMLVLPLCVHAQDGRQRDYQTIVADGLAQLPISETEKRNQVMAELTNTGTKGMEMMADMLVPADKGKNARVEYAISGVVDYVTINGNKEQKEAVRRGLILSIDKCKDNANRAFLLSKLQQCSTVEDIPVFIKYLDDSYLADYAIRGLVATPGSENALLELIEQKKAPLQVLAHAAYEKELKSAEPFLLEWLADADKDTRKAIFKALSVCGSSVSLKPLYTAAKEEGYEWSKDKEATAAYLNLLNKLMAEGETKTAVKAGKKLLKNDHAYIRGAALDVILKGEGEKGMSYVRSALKDKDIEVRNSALHSVTAFANDQVYATVVKWMPSLSDEACVDVVNWLGSCHAASQLDAVVEAMQSANDALAAAGIAAAGRIGGPEALKALMIQLDGKYADEAVAALLAFNGDIKEGVIIALQGNASVQKKALELCTQRRITDVSEQVFSMLRSEDPSIKEAAYKALPNVVELADADRVAGLLEKSDALHIAALQNALKKAVSTQSGTKQCEIVTSYMSGSATPDRFYPILAQTNTNEAVDALNKEFAAKGDNTAFKSLLTIDNPKMIDILYQIAGKKTELKEQALKRYITLVAKSSWQNARKLDCYQQALQLNPSTEVQKKTLEALSNIRKYPSLMLAAPYLDKKETAAVAAATVKTIVAKSDERLSGDAVKGILEKTREIYKTLPGADAGYAVDEITNLLSKLLSAPVFTLPEEEKRKGFEILFDGTSLDKWTGNKNSYVIENGTIYVSAGYGSGGNLYTQKEYSDFVLRFEFCFDREGVNNGIGIRTPMGVDAAYHGMEIQILDHDAPIYKGLHEYQQHGSVYGIIPAKRVKFGTVGTWNVEEIRAVGDHITVTVNGEVILDGNIRKACQGHNVSKDGSGRNPYTVDHLNHPGLFNKKGHIGLCGHGAGIRFRNMRVLDLSSQKQVE